MMNVMKRFVNIFIGTTLALLAQFSFSCADAKVRQYKVQVVKEYIHDETSFTQGLFFLDGEMIETTGQYGESTLYGSEDLRDNPLHFERRHLLAKDNRQLLAGSQHLSAFW